MNELLQKHGCSNVFTVPEGLKELMSDITREVLRWQPAKMLDFIANYLSALLITREHGIMAVKILDDLCDCRPTVSEHLLQIGLERHQAEDLATIIKMEIEGFEPGENKEKVKETAILKKALNMFPMDEEMSAKVCQVARNAYRDYWYRRSILKQSVKTQPEEAWEKAAQHTLDIYKKTRPSMSELQRATIKIQAAYRGYHVRRNVLRHLMPPPKKKNTRKVELPGPPLDIASSREIDLGPVIHIKIKEDNVSGMFETEAQEELGLKYDPMTTITVAKDSTNQLVVCDDYIEPDKTPKSHGSEITSSMTTLGAEGISTESDWEQTMPIPEGEYSYDTQRTSFVEDQEPKVSNTLVDNEELEVPEVPGIDTDIVEPQAIPSGALEIPEELPGDSEDEGSAHTVEDENE